MAPEKLVFNSGKIQLSGMSFSKRSGEVGFLCVTYIQTELWSTQPLF